MSDIRAVRVSSECGGEFPGMKSAPMPFCGRRANLTGIADIYLAFPPEKLSLVNPGSGTRS